MKKLARASVALATGSLVLGLTALPGGAQVPEPDVELTGVAACNLGTGHETYTLTWTLTNNSPSLIPTGELSTQGILDVATIEVDGAEQSGAWEGSLTFTPATVSPQGGTAVASDGPVPNRAGVVTAEVEFFYYANEETYTVDASVVLDGTCTAPMPTNATTSTTTPAAAPAARVRPTFTG